MSRVLAALSTAAFVALAAAPATAGCANCYVPAPQPCVTCYQQRVIPPQYQTVHENVMVSPGRRVAHRVPAQYQTVMVPKTVMVSPESVQYEEIPAQYATVARTQMVAPALRQLRLVAAIQDLMRLWRPGPSDPAACVFET
jgi:hypothetical protein